ncbi:hypothetical protein KAR91_33695 [Candidatus Pacearchaeota archaeon]|nr:hypothetical protein [Candidatus Pacearchaeota archaeon]
MDAIIVDGEKVEEVSEKVQDAEFEAGRSVARGEEPDIKVQKILETAEAESKDKAKKEGDDGDILDGAAGVDDDDNDVPDLKDGDKPKEDADGDDPPAEPIVLAGLTEPELKVILAKANEFDSLKEAVGGESRKIFGKIGELNKKIASLTDQKAGSKVTLESLKNLQADYPDLAKALAKDLESLTLGAQAASNGMGEEDINKIVESRVAGATDALSITFEKKLISIKHPDWKEVRGSDDCSLWKSTLTPEAKTKFEQSNDGLFISSQLDVFDEWVANGKSAGKKTKNKKRLEANLTPEGAPAPTIDKSTLSEDDAFEAGRKKARESKGLK